MISLSQYQRLLTLPDRKLLRIISTNINYQRQSELSINQPSTKRIRRNNIPVLRSIDLDNRYHNTDLFGVNQLHQEFS